VSQIDYEMNEISLYGPNGKPDWFWKLNPKGTVPVLDCGGKGVWADSDLILDRLPELLPRGSLVLTASNREHEKLVRAWRLDIKTMLAIGRAAIQSGKNKSMQQQLCSMLQRLENNVIGPFLCGEEVTTADCAAFPFLWRLDTSSYLDEYPTLRKWLEHCQTHHPAFSTTIQSSWWWWW
jgi:glutathione S-transferase